MKFVGFFCKRSLCACLYDDRLIKKNNHPQVSPKILLFYFIYILCCFPPINLSLHLVFCTHALLLVFITHDFSLFIFLLCLSL